MVEHEKHLGNYVSTNIILGSFHVRSPKKNEIGNGTPSDFDKIVYTSSL